MLIDFHTHAFADRIAPRAVQQLPWLNDEAKERIRGINAARLLDIF